MREKIKSARERVERLLTTPGEELGRWGRFFRYQVNLWRFCVRRLRRDNAVAMAAALSYCTIFALVPTLVLSFLAMRSIGVVDTHAAMRAALDRGGFHNIVIVADDGAAAAPVEPVGPVDPPPNTTALDDGEADEAIIPAVAIRLDDKIMEIVGSVESKLDLGHIGPVGLVILVYAVLSLLTTVERSLNRMFDAPRSRSFGRRVIVYWSVVTFVPIAMVVAGIVESRLKAGAAQIPAVAWLLGPLGRLESGFVSILLLAAVYKLMPNTPVRFRAAVGGAIVSIVLWLTARWGFSIYVGAIVRNPSLYGALGLLPLFLIWLNLSWLIFLFGAELAHTAANLDRMRAAEAASDMLLGPWDLLAAALAVAHHYAQGRGLIPQAEVAAELGMPETIAYRLLGRLVDAGLLCRTDDGSPPTYGLARPAELVPLLEILGRPAAQAQGLAATRRYSAPLATLIAPLQNRADAGLEDLTLADAISPR